MKFYNINHNAFEQLLRHFPKKTCTKCTCSKLWTLTKQQIISNAIAVRFTTQMW